MPQDGALIRHLRVDEAAMLARLRATSFGHGQAREDDVARTAELLAEHLASGDFLCVVRSTGRTSSSTASA